MAKSSSSTVTDCPALFPLLPAPATRGLAALAQAATDAAVGHDIQFKLLATKSLLNRTVSKRRLSLAYSVNPYRGCEFACRYFYARYTHGFFAPGSGNGGQASVYEDAASFEKLIFLKENAAWLLEQELRKIDPRDEIAIGTATDPYQPIERTARITRSLLEVFSRRRGHRIGIVTKSQLILRDADLLAEIARQNTLVVHVTVTTADAALARLLEPRAPRPELRLRAVQQLRLRGITAGVLCSPLLPGITDTREHIFEMARQVALTGASFFAAEPLFLKPCSRPTFLDFIREHFPELEQLYHVRFNDRDFAEPAYRNQLQVFVADACRLYGLAHRSTDALLTRDAAAPKAATGSAACQQQNLFV